MNPTEHRAMRSHIQTGFAAALRALYRVEGRGALPRVVDHTLTGFALCATALFLLVPSASASQVHSFLYQLHFAGSASPGALSPKAFGVAVDNSSSGFAGDVYVSHTANTTEGIPVAVAKFVPSSSSASFLCQITGLGELASEPTRECDTSAVGPGVFEAPRGVTVDPSSGFVYVIDAARHRVYQFEASGKYTEKSLNLGTASALRLDVSKATGNVFVADETNKRVTEWDPATEAIKTFAAEAGSPLAAFGSVTAVAVDNDPTSPNYEDVYVADSAKKVVDRFSPTGAYQCQITGEGSASTSSSECSKAKPGGEGAVEGVLALAVDPANGHLYIADERSAYVCTYGCGYSPQPFIDEYTPAGDYLATIDYKELRAASGGNVPFALAVSASTGDLFEASVNNADELFAFGPDAPIVSTARPTAVTSTSATFEGTVNPIGVEVTGCKFEYLEASKYEPQATEPFSGAQTVTCEVEGGGSIGAGSSPVSVHAQINLAASTGYTYRIHAENARASSVGQVVLFGPPAAKTDAATELTQASATLNGTVEPGNVPTTYQFEYGDADGEPGVYGHTVPVTPALAGEGSGEVAVSQHLSGLQLGATYHYRLTATSASGTYHGVDRSFTTLPAALIDAQPAASIGAHQAILQAYVNPLGSTLTKCRFEYVEAAQYEPSAPDPYAGGASVPCEGALASGSSPTLAEAKLEGLSPQAEYHFRLLAESPAGTVEGPDEPLTTEPAPGSCPNEARRIEQGSTYLPECRAFEQVSPEYKNASPTEEGPWLAPSGERVRFQSRGIFAGTASNPYAFPDYIAERGPEGWHTVGIQPNPAPFGAAQVFNYLGGTGTFYSPDLSQTVFEARYASGLDPIYTAEKFYIREPDGSFVQASSNIEALNHLSIGPIEWGREPSENLSKLIFENTSSGGQVTPDGLPPSAPRLYEVDGFGTPAATVRLVNVDSEEPGGIESCPGSGFHLSPGSKWEPAGLPGMTPSPGASNGELYLLSADGSHVFFTAETHRYGCHWLVYVRLNGTETIEFSRPTPNEQCTTTTCLTAPVSDASFAGASADGERAFVLSGGQLTDEATQFTPGTTSHTASTNLYLYDFKKPSGHRLTDVSAGDASGRGPLVQTLVATAKDASRGYFLAQGVLTGQPNSLGQTARAGADNLYVYDTETDQASFIADLCDGEEKTGTLTGFAPCVGAGERGDAIGVESGGVRRGGGDAATALTPDGHYLFFATHAKLTPEDENEAEDVYRYDALTGAFARVTVGHDREDQNGNGSALSALMGTGQGGTSESGSQGFGRAYQDRRITPDGQSAIFVTPRSLQAGDENLGTHPGCGGSQTGCDLYLWHQGQVSRISTGRPGVNQRDGIVSDSGNDVVFSNSSELAPGDTDGLRDVYDARVGGGFAPQIPPPVCTSAETCHGKGTESGPPPNITHIVGPENEPHCHRGFVLRHGKCVKAKHHKRHKRHKRAHRRASANRRAGK